jgi:16S rRNA (uracil1498-N3)-methyltransferase
LRVFNERCGEHLAELQLTGARSKNAVLTIKDLLRNADSERSVILPCTLLVAPIKKTRMKVLLEKATELGVANIIPVVTQNTQHQTENLDQFRSTLIQSAEQCERLSIPVIHDLIGLGKLLEGYKPSVVKTGSGVGEGGYVHELLVCAERLDAVHHTHGQTTGPRGVAKPLLTEVQRILSTQKYSGSPSTSTFSILIGPEGGFTEKELDLMAAHPTVTLVSLGPSILRAETAALYALSTVSCAVQANRVRDTAAEAYLK